MRVALQAGEVDSHIVAHAPAAPGVVVKIVTVQIHITLGEPQAIAVTHAVAGQRVGEKIDVQVQAAGPFHIKFRAGAVGHFFHLPTHHGVAAGGFKSTVGKFPRRSPGGLCGAFLELFLLLEWKLRDHALRKSSVLAVGKGPVLRVLWPLKENFRRGETRFERFNVGGVDEYDKSLLISEMNLFREWLIEKHLNIKLSDSQVKILTTLFDLLVNNALQQPKVFVHRDFHSRNLMVTKENNPGVIDYQDAVYGPISYDLVSILKDCYIKWPKEEIDKWIDFYLNKLYEEKAQYRINRDEFVRWFDLMGVQRHLKASGIFTRLSHRDGKHNFLEDIPRTLSYILDLKETYEELQPICIILEELVLPRLKENE